MEVVDAPAISSKVQLASVEDVIPKAMDVEDEPPCGEVQADAFALEVPTTTTGAPHPFKGLTEAVLTRSAYDGETIAILRNAIARKPRMIRLRIFLRHRAR
jgi:hypothetical protein